jgi:hypothetical protein
VTGRGEALSLNRTVSRKDSKFSGMLLLSLSGINVDWPACRCVVTKPALIVEKIMYGASEYSSLAKLD